MIPIESIEEACYRISRYVLHTPVTFDRQLGLFFKWENQQKTGSFKLRGALNKVLSLSREQLANGLVTCSAGNHGQGVAFAARQAGAECIVFVPDHAATVKVEAMRAWGAEVRPVKGGYEDAEGMAIEQAAATEKIFISPYNDLAVMAGH
jgi:threonine dehydratase